MHRLTVFGSEFDWFQIGLNGLTWAAAKGNEHLFEMLLEYGFKLDQVDNDMNTALHWAGISGQVSAFNKLIDLGANTKCRNKSKLAPSINVDNHNSNNNCTIA